MKFLTYRRPPLSMISNPHRSRLRRVLLQPLSSQHPLAVFVMEQNYRTTWLSQQNTGDLSKTLERL